MKPEKFLRGKWFLWGAVQSLLLIGLISSTGSASAQDETISQNGSVVSTDDGQGNFPTVDVNFPQEFGGTPTVTMTCPGGWSHGHRVRCVVSLTPTNVTSTGFRAVLGGDGNASGEHLPLTVSWTAVGPALQRGTAVPNYLILTIIYAPPGTAGGHSTSSVSYQSGSTAGTVTSSSGSFQNATGISVEASGGLFQNGGGVGVSFDSAISSTDSQSLEIKKTTTTTISQAGPSQDGINHDEDEIWLLLKPTVNLALSSSITEWMLADTNAPVQYVHVGWLNGHETMPPGVASSLQSAGISPKNYPDILAHDPLAIDESALHSSRFNIVNTTFPYEPPYSANDPVPTSTYSISNSQAKTRGTAAEDSYKVQLTILGSASYAGLATLKLKDTSTWEWTNKSSSAASDVATQSAQLIIGGPAYGFTGPSVMRVYYDTVYRTFAFALESVDPDSVALSGTLLTSKGTPASNKQVALLEGVNRHVTYTNAKGEFAFLGPMSGKGTIQATGIVQIIPHLQSTRRVTLHPKR